MVYNKRNVAQAITADVIEEMAARHRSFIAGSKLKSSGSAADPSQWGFSIAATTTHEKRI
jgi:hypothetical protein